MLGGAWGGDAPFDLELENLRFVGAGSGVSEAEARVNATLRGGRFHAGEKLRGGGFLRGQRRGAKQEGKEAGKGGVEEGGGRHERGGI